MISFVIALLKNQQYPFQIQVEKEHNSYYYLQQPNKKLLIHEFIPNSNASTIEIDGASPVFEYESKTITKAKLVITAWKCNGVSVRVNTKQFNVYIDILELVKEKEQHLLHLIKRRELLKKYQASTSNLLSLSVLQIHKDIIQSQNQKKDVEQKNKTPKTKNKRDKISVEKQQPSELRQDIEPSQQKSKPKSRPKSKPKEIIIEVEHDENRESIKKQRKTQQKKSARKDIDLPQQEQNLAYDIPDAQKIIKSNSFQPRPLLQPKKIVIQKKFDKKYLAKLSNLCYQLSKSYTLDYIMTNGNTLKTLTFEKDLNIIQRTLMPSRNEEEVEGNIYGQAKKKSFSKKIINTVKSLI